MVDVFFCVHSCSLTIKMFYVEDVCSGGEGEWDSPCWCWADSRWGHSQSDFDVMLSFFVRNCLRCFLSCNWDLHLMMCLWVMCQSSFLAHTKAFIQWEFLSEECISFLVSCLCQDVFCWRDARFECVVCSSYFGSAWSLAVLSRVCKHAWRYRK